MILACWERLEGFVLDLMCYFMVSLDLFELDLCRVVLRLDFLIKEGWYHSKDDTIVVRVLWVRFH